MKQNILIICFLFCMTAFANAQNGRGLQQNKANCPAYVDANKDGVCDNYRTANCQYNKGVRNAGNMQNARGIRKNNGICNGQGYNRGRGACLRNAQAYRGK